MRQHGLRPHRRPYPEPASAGRLFFSQARPFPLSADVDEEETARPGAPLQRAAGATAGSRAADAALPSTGAEGGGLRSIDRAVPPVQVVGTPLQARTPCDEPAAEQFPDPRRRGAAAPLYRRGGAAADRRDGDRTGRGHPGLRPGGPRLHRGPRRPLVLRAWLRQCRTGRGGGGADGQAPLLPHLRRQEPRAGGRARREDQGAGAGDGAGLLPDQRLRGERHPDQVRLVLQQRQGAAAEEEDHQPHQGLPRRHHRLRLADRPAQQPPRLRPAGRGHPSHHDAALLEGRRARRERGSLLGAARRRPRRADRGRGPGHRRGLHRRAGDGRRRGDRAAEGLFPGARRGLPQARRADDLRRGDLRLRADRGVVRTSGPRLPRDVLLGRETADRRLPAPVRGGDERRHGGDHRGELRQDRHARPRLYLRRTPGGLRRRDQDARNLSPHGRHRPRAAAGAALRRAFRAARRASAGRRGRGSSGSSAASSWRRGARPRASPSRERSARASRRN